MMARGNVSRYSKKINDAIIGAAKLLLDIWKGTNWLKIKYVKYFIYMEKRL
jgi:hypothetical protein